MEIYGEVKNRHIYVALERNCVLERKTTTKKMPKVIVDKRGEDQGVLQNEVLK